MGQQNITDQKFSPSELKTDLEFLKQKIFNVHANPYNELTHDSYEKVFDSINSKITVSLSVTDFFKLIRPVVSYLSDEHSAITLPKQLSISNNNPIFLPFAIKQAGNHYVIDTIFEDRIDLQSGDVIESVNQISIQQAVANCEPYTTGFPNQRKEKAIKQFGYLFPLAYPMQSNFKIRKKNGQEISMQGTTAKNWLSYLNKLSGENIICEPVLTYRKYDTYGYINACSFNVTNNKNIAYFEGVIDSIFAEVKKDNVRSLIIDISKNRGGNSAVGDLLINHFYNKPYKDYQCNWKRSNDYLNLMKSWKIENKEYEQTKAGDILHYNSEVIEPAKNSNFFMGKVYILVGSGTFSSAIQFATIVKDNSMAAIIGQVPEDGHPNHFGEMYSTELPNTKINLRFGVKEWIRPAGKTPQNILTPEILFKLSENYTIAEIISNLK